MSISGVATDNDVEEKLPHLWAFGLQARVCFSVRVEQDPAEAPRDHQLGLNAGHRGPGHPRADFGLARRADVFGICAFPVWVRWLLAPTCLENVVVWS